MATATWEWDALGVTGKWIRRVVRDEASGLADRFVSDYLSANP